MTEDPAATAIQQGKFLSWTPSFKIGSYESAVDHYVDWLGFNLDWEWRAEPDQPVIMAISRDGLSLFLNEGGDGPSATTLRASVSNLRSLADEWNEKRPGSVEVFLEPPYEIPTAYIRDPFGNMLAIQQPQTEEEAAKRATDIERVREQLRQQLSANSSRPTANELVEELGVSMGIAIEVLNESWDWKQ